MPLKVSDGIGAYIDDFQKSDAPQFKGKSKKERRDMAIAAYLTAKRGGKAQDENVKSADRKPEVYTKPDGKKGVRMVPVDREVVKAEAYTMGKPVEKKKLPTNEISTDKLSRYINKASSQLYQLGKKQGQQNTPPPSKQVHGIKITKLSDTEKKGAKRVAGIMHATSKLAKKASANEGLDVGEKTYMRTDSKLKNLKVPVTRKKGKVIKPEFKLASAKREALDAKDKPFVKDLIKKLRGGSKVHAKQADDLEKAMNTEALKVGSTVKPTKGPHAGHPHEIIHDFGNGHYNIKPKNMSPSRNKYRMGATKVHKDDLKEEMNFAVSIEGLPTMFMSADSPGMLKQTLRKIVKQPSMIQSVKRVTDAKVKKTFRLKAQGKEGEE